MKIFSKKQAAGQVTPTRQSVGQVFESSRSMTTGFDYMRIVMTCVVIAWHAIVVINGTDSEEWASWLRPLPGLLLPMFFSLSGFLVATSLSRSRSLTEFMVLRSLRVFPALIVSVLFTALLLGCFSSLSYQEYVLSPLFAEYLLNSLGLTRYFLPGVFEDNPYPSMVNVSLWTVQIEIICYFMLAGLAWLGWQRWPRLVVAGLLLAMVWLTLLAYPERELLQAVRNKGKSLMLCFFAGVLIHHYRHRIPVDGRLFLAAAVLSVLLISQGWLQYLATPFIAYATVYIGLLNPPKRTILLQGDYSYGMYVMAFPIQQLHAQLMGGQGGILANALVGIVLGFLYARVSWHGLEKPLMDRKKQILASLPTLARAQS